MAETFRKGFGQLLRGKVPGETTETLSQVNSDANLRESLVESQLSFLRAASAMSLAIEALLKLQTGTLTSFEAQDTLQLQLDSALID